MLSRSDDDRFGCVLHGTAEVGNANFLFGNTGNQVSLCLDVVQAEEMTCLSSLPSFLKIITHLSNGFRFPPRLYLCEVTCRCVNLVRVTPLQQPLWKILTVLLYQK